MLFALHGGASRGPLSAVDPSNPSHRVPPAMTGQPREAAAATGVGFVPRPTLASNGANGDRIASAGRTGLIAFGAMVCAVVTMALVRGPYGPADAAVASAATDDQGSSRSKTSSESSGSARASSSAVAAGSGSASDLPPDAEAARAQFKSRWRVRDARSSLAAFEQLVKLDGDALKDKELQADVVGLSMLASQLPGDEGERVFGLLTKKTGTHGLDVLYTLITTKGGTQAAETADRLLKNPDVLAAGSKAMQVAYTLRKGTCDEKKATFKTAGEHGDGRAYSQLVDLSKSCSRRRRNLNACCLEDDPDLKAAIEAIEARQK